MPLDTLGSIEKGLSFNKANGRTILVSAAMIDSSELIVAILRKYPHML